MRYDKLARLVEEYSNTTIKPIPFSVAHRILNIASHFVRFEGKSDNPEKLIEKRRF